MRGQDIERIVIGYGPGKLRYHTVAGFHTLKNVCAECLSVELLQTS